MNAASVVRDLESFKDPRRALLLARYFKTGKGEYAEGDIFWGLTLPEIRSLIRKYRDLPLAEIRKLLKSPVHEVRLTGFLIMVARFRKGDAAQKKRIHNLYLSNTKYVNNWDLVDLTAPTIMGSYLQDKPRDILFKMARSGHLWDRRISLLSCFWFIKNDEFTDALRIAEMLLSDTQDLVHKALGWLLREIGKRDISVEEAFLRKYYRRIPRTALRYAIEKFPEEKRQRYLKGTI